MVEGLLCARSGHPGHLLSYLYQDCSEQLDGSPDVILCISIPIRNSGQLSFELLYEDMCVCNFILSTF